MKSKTHSLLIKVVPSHAEILHDVLPSLFKCETCNKCYSSVSTLNRHIKNNCKTNNNIKSNTMDTMIKQYEIIINKYETMNEKLLEYSKNRVSTTYNISVKNYIYPWELSRVQQNYSDASLGALQGSAT